MPEISEGGGGTPQITDEQALIIANAVETKLQELANAEFERYSTTDTSYNADFHPTFMSHYSLNNIYGDYTGKPHGDISAVELFARDIKGLINNQGYNRELDYGGGEICFEEVLVQMSALLGDGTINTTSKAAAMDAITDILIQNGIEITPELQERLNNYASEAGHYRNHDGDDHLLSVGFSFDTVTDKNYYAIKYDGDFLSVEHHYFNDDTKESKTSYIFGFSHENLQEVIEDGAAIKINGPNGQEYTFPSTMLNYTSGAPLENLSFIVQEIVDGKLNQQELNAMIKLAESDRVNLTASQLFDMVDNNPTNNTLPDAKPVNPFSTHRR